MSSLSQTPNRSSHSGLRPVWCAHGTTRTGTSRGCPKLNLQVRTDNTDALGFYAALGYSADAAVSLGKRLIPDS